MDNQADRLSEICCRRLGPGHDRERSLILLSEPAQGHGPARYLAPDN
jgi:hypothetical protein